MINLIKADLYRLFRSKTFKSCLIGCLGIIIFVLGLSIFTNSNLYIMSIPGKDGIHRAFQIGLNQGDAYSQFIRNALGSGAGIYVVGICLTSATVVSRIKSGIMKNTVPYGYERWKIYVSQLISLVIGISILVSITFVSIIVISIIALKPEAINYEGVLLTIKALILYISVIAAVVSIYLLLATVIGSSEAVSAIAMCEILGVGILGGSLPTKVNAVLPYSMIRTLAKNPESVEFVPYLLTGLLIIGVATFCGVLVFNKKEVK